MAIKKPKILNLFSNKKIQSSLDLLDKNLADIYQQTHYSSRDDMTDSSTIRSDIEKTVSNIMNKNFGEKDAGNIGRIYDKMFDTSDDKNIIDAIEGLNTDSLTQSVISSWTDGRYIRDLHNHIDNVLRYAPKLKEALNCKKDCVLSADHFAKDFLNFTNILSSDKEQLFNRRMEELMKVYHLPEKSELWYIDADTYGEELVYIVPYKKEFSRMLKDKNIHQNLNTITESNIDLKSRSYDQISLREMAISESAIKYAEEIGWNNLKISINTSGILESSARQIDKADALYEAGIYNNSVGQYFTENYILEAKDNQNTLEKRDRFGDKIVPDDLKMEDEDPASEMLIDHNKRKSSENIAIDVPGCIVKELDPANTILLYLEDICLGYFYIEVEGDVDLSQQYQDYDRTDGFRSAANPHRFTRTVAMQRNEEKNQLINYITKEIYKNIDARFINDNQELRKEIYTILKHNELFNITNGSVQNGHIKVSFLYASDVVHIAFKKNKKTHRGESSLKYSLFPATLYSTLYITNVLGIITRGQDKRIYYVKQNVETNISQTMLNVLNQIKKGNFGVRSFDNLNNILNITGRFNDIIMPMSSAGDPPVTMEVLEGQRMTDNSELLSLLEKQMIDPICPYDLIEARQSLDYAIQATMSNSRLMRDTYKIQDVYEIFLSTIFSKIYNYEYDEHEDIKVTLPAPSFLNANNGQQLLQATSGYIDGLLEMELADKTDEVKMEFKKLAMRYYMPTHVNLNLIDRFVKEAEINVAKKLQDVENEE